MEQKDVEAMLRELTGSGKIGFVGERGATSGHALPLTFAVKFCNSAGRALLRAGFPIPHLDDEFKPCALQPERVEFFRAFQERYAGRPGVLEGGRVIETGTHAALLARDGAYTRLIAAQRDGVLTA